MHIVLWDTRRGGASPRILPAALASANSRAAAGWRPRLIRRAFTRDRRPVALAYAYLAAIFRELGHTVEYAEDRVPAGADVYVFHPALVTLPLERRPCGERSTHRPVAECWWRDSSPTRSPRPLTVSDVTLLRGEPEQLVLEARRSAGRFERRVVDLGRVADLDALPIPDWSLFEPRRFRVSATISRRFPTGLVQSEPGLHAVMQLLPLYLLEMRSAFAQPENVVAEIERASARHGFRSFKFRDPLFGLDRRRTLELAERLGRLPRQVQFSIESRIDLLARRHAAGACATPASPASRLASRRPTKRRCASRRRRSRRPAARLHRPLPAARHPHRGRLHDRISGRHPRADRVGAALCPGAESHVRQFQRRDALSGHGILRPGQAPDRRLRLCEVQRLPAGAEIPAFDCRSAWPSCKRAVRELLLSLSLAGVECPPGVARFAVAGVGPRANGIDPEPGSPPARCRRGQLASRNNKTTSGAAATITANSVIPARRQHAA